MKKRRVIVLGATGSIGQSTAKVAREHPDRMELVGLAAYHNAKLLAEQANEFRPPALCLVDHHAAQELKQYLHKDYHPKIFVGKEGLIELVQASFITGADMVLVSIVGTGGLEPALAAIEMGFDIAVASKEILVMAGEIVMREAANKNVKVLPVDSEHNAIFQCLEGRDPATVKRIILTASGGPFRNLPSAELEHVTVAQALKHPTWNMGPKITIDSATLFNKGLEMIEARWLFQIPMSKVDVVIHPQSIVHSMVEFVDSSVLAQLSHSDMCFPIQYAVTWPDRVLNNLKPLDFAKLGKLEFEAPRVNDFPALSLARRAGEAGGTLPTVLNAANEIAVKAFQENKISFPDIWRIVKKVMDTHCMNTSPTLHALFTADKAAREAAIRLCSDN